MDECLIYSVDTQFIDEMATTTIWEGRGFVFRFSHTLFLTFFRSFSLKVSFCTWLPLSSAARAAWGPRFMKAEI